MIDCLTLENEQHFPGLRKAMHQLRYQEFVLKQHYHTHAFAGLEFDDYDNPASVYLLYRDPAGEILGMSRLYPTQLPYMLENIWPEYVTHKALPKTATIWESSRMMVATRDPELKQQVIGELVTAHCEFAQIHGIKSFIGIMPEKVFTKVWTRRGWPFVPLGEVGPDGIAGELKVTPQLLGELRRNCQIKQAVLRYPR